MSDLLIWLDAKPERYWGLVCLVFFIVSFCALRPLLRKSCDRDRSTSDWRWAWAIAAVLLVGRWPTLWMNFELNCDESEFVAAAHTLRHDPVFWRSVDTHTSGPLNTYALLPVGSMLGKDSFLSARITALLLLAGAFLFAHQSVALVFGRSAARLGGLAALFFEALTIHTEFLHYSSELVSIALLAAAFYWGAHTTVTKSSKFSAWFGMGVLLGAVPFAKLQGGPIAALLWFNFVFLNARSTKGASGFSPRKSGGALIAGTLSPALFFSAMMLTTDEGRGAWISYVLNSFEYVGAAKLAITDVVTALIQATLGDGALIQTWLATTAGLLLVLLPLKRTRMVTSRWFLINAGSFLLISALCILTPRRAFPHYLQLLVIPWTLLASAATGVLLQTREDHPHAFAKTALALLAFIPCAAVFHRGLGVNHPSFLKSNNFKSNAPLVQILQPYSRPGDSLAVWGWMPKYYVEMGLVQATRESVTMNQIFPGPYRAFFRDRYMQDLHRAMPPVFVDAAQTNQNSRLRDRPQAADDPDFAELATFIREDYTPIQELDGARIYIRNDRLNSSSSSITSGNPSTHPI